VRPADIHAALEIAAGVTVAAINYNRGSGAGGDLAANEQSKWLAALKRRMR